ncbi:FAD-linked oxidase C-terminal domain-containing protein [Reichenbachiella sp. MALMAid0571]|uniref:FAD-binding and (Fe-S)-binding domain-containing protein n=1 Tax=Reichenbachiella sp. MALMAid0571 TaxID=3143939 RepID=UPI0032DF345D
MNRELTELQSSLDGELFFDETMRKLYATDASAYREMPLAVAMPKNESDIKLLIAFAHKNATSLIPRTAGTSLAGQVVGGGIIVDVSKHFCEVLEVNESENWARVQPGVIRDDLNRYLKNYNRYFGPETSTANRAMIGGMVGNNSCGSNSVVYGSTRDHLLEVKGFLSDGTYTTFKSMSGEEFLAAMHSDSELEASIYKAINEMLSSSQNVENIKREFPKPSIERRNTGYAIDMLAINKPFNPEGEDFNFCKLIAGSEGTLMFITEIKLNTIPLPSRHKALVCIHCEDVNESLRANLIGLKYGPHASELMDHYILECTKKNTEQQKNRFFVQGDPGAILVVELVAENEEALDKKCNALIDELKKENLGYHYPIVTGEDVGKVWNLRKAGLGLLSNIPGDAKAAPVIEDTAVDVQDLPQYIIDFNEILKKHNMSCVHYAHAGSGELHLRPIINLKTKEGHEQYRTIATEIAHLVKKYKGSLSGEHGDGRLRGEFIKTMIGDSNYQLLEDLKNTWDPKGIFNPGKITNTPPMDSNLRYEADRVEPEIETYFDWSKNQGVLRSAELCNGSGDCRKSPMSGGTMCPSFMATRNEKDTTRSRANILREILTNSEKPNRFDSEEIKEVMDLCLSCKGCKSECPSNVDMARLKAEFQQNYFDVHGIPLKTKLTGRFNQGMKMASIFPPAYNFMVGNPVMGKIFKSFMGIAEQRPMPRMPKQTLKKWYKKTFKSAVSKDTQTVYLFADEFTNFQDVEIGKKVIQLLDRLNYNVIIPEHEESCRTFISKGMLKEAIPVINKNIKALSGLVTKETPLIGIEPSAILTLKDEYPDLCDAELKEKSLKLAENILTFEEFITQEFENGNIKSASFKTEEKLVRAHGHCHQKALSSVVTLKKALSIPENYTVQMIPSGCCGMAGSFGYEKEHYDVSMKIGELVLFPTVRSTTEDTIIAAPGTSCRHQIHDGTGRNSKHPAEILFEALM